MRSDLKAMVDQTYRQRVTTQGAERATVFQVLGHAQDAADAAVLLDVLGLLPAAEALGADLYGRAAS